MKLIRGEALKEMNKFKNNSIDHIITSPPYNMNLIVRNGKYTSRQIVKELSSKYEGFSDNLSMEEYFKFTKNILKECLRVTRGYIFYNIQFITGNKRALFKIIGEFNKYIKEIII
jgi:site-specific DNA-methyltransferase (adenine-specific)/modification methylase